MRVQDPIVEQALFCKETVEAIVQSLETGKVDQKYQRSLDRAIELLQIAIDNPQFCVLRIPDSGMKLMNLTEIDAVAIFSIIKSLLDRGEISIGVGDRVSEVKIILQSWQELLRGLFKTADLAEQQQLNREAMDEMLLFFTVFVKAILDIGAEGRNKISAMPA